MYCFNYGETTTHVKLHVARKGSLDLDSPLLVLLYPVDLAVAFPCLSTESAGPALRAYLFCTQSMALTLVI